MTNQGFALIGLISLAMILVYFWTGQRVAPARKTHNVPAPRTEGSDDFNRVYRAHVNTLEQLVVTLPALWIMAQAVNARYAAILGVIWIGARIHYVLSYSQAADKRGTGFIIGFVATLVAVLWSAIALALILFSHYR